MTRSSTPMISAFIVAVTCARRTPSSPAMAKAACRSLVAFFERVFFLPLPLDSVLTSVSSITDFIQASDCPVSSNRYDTPIKELSKLVFNSCEAICSSTCDSPAHTRSLLSRSYRLSGKADFLQDCMAASLLVAFSTTRENLCRSSESCISRSWRRPVFSTTPKMASRTLRAAHSTPCRSSTSLFFSSSALRSTAASIIARASFANKSQWTPCGLITRRFGLRLFNFLAAVAGDSS
mmetsp:Transcript_3739/g.7883  ORF Transcript_3739/g.7883 Transcript_3739/m.7883 type:complete len:236 (-) Transcript_3739:1248-1955(-)